MLPENNDPVDDVLDEAAKAAKEKEAADTKAKAESDAAKEKSDAEAKAKNSSPKGDTRSLDELIKDPKIRESIKSVRGWNDSQLDAAYQMAPMQEEMARLKTEKKYPDFEKYKDVIDQELLGVAIFDRTPQLMEKLYFMAKGKQAIENPRRDEPAKKPGVVGERIHAPYPPSSSGSGGDGGGGKPSTLTEEEKQYAAFLGVPEDRYEASKKGYDPADKRRIRPAPRYQVPQGGNSADVSLGVLLRSRK